MAQTVISLAARPLVCEGELRRCDDKYTNGTDRRESQGQLDSRFRARCRLGVLGGARCLALPNVGRRSTLVDVDSDRPRRRERLVCVHPLSYASIEVAIVRSNCVSVRVYCVHAALGAVPTGGLTRGRERNFHGRSSSHRGIPLDSASLAGISVRDHRRPQVDDPGISGDTTNPYTHEGHRSPVVR